MAGSYTWLVPMLAPLIAALIAYFSLIRRTSGRVSTTEADKIWEEAAKLRDVYREEIKRLRDDELRCEGEVASLEKHNRELRAEVAQLQRERDDLERANRRLTYELENNHASK